ncbi:MAG: DUF3793 family protein [Treponema sp.]|nr:DUF3793 family protein [Treponema sp.]
MSFDKVFISCAAPAFCGIKAGNLFSLPVQLFNKEKYEEWKKLFLSVGLKCRAVKISSKKILVLVYNSLWINEILSSPHVSAYLKSKGYLLDFGESEEAYKKGCNKNLWGLLNESEAFISSLFYRIQYSSSFPHEIGILLGYPLQDVIAFEKSQGKNFSFCGIWKCYSESREAVEKARLCQCRFRECSGLCSEWFEQGCSLCQIIEKYKKRGNYESCCNLRKYNRQYRNDGKRNLSVSKRKWS